ncbi:MAG: hypothetical protein C4289_04700 [Chloroflexota bacterium]
MLRAGAACLDITPPLGTPLRGFFHERRARAVHDPLYVRSLALEQDGAGIVMAICDLIGVRRAYLDRARARIAETVGLSPERVLIACTHTHTGPVLKQSLVGAYIMPPDQQARVVEYTAELQGKVVAVIGNALKDLAPARPAFGSGAAHFGVNRRQITPKGVSIGDAPQGPSRPGRARAARRITAGRVARSTLQLRLPQHDADGRALPAERRLRGLRATCVGAGAERPCSREGVLFLLAEEAVMHQVNVEEPVSQLSALIHAAVSGEEVVFTENDQPVVKLVPLTHERPQPKFGSARGMI